MNAVSTQLLKAALHALYYTRLDAALAPVTQGAGVILMLHHVVPDEPPAFAPNRILSITPEFLNVVVEQVRARGFDIISIDEAYQRMASGKRAANRFATFTFDDGYRDNIEHALPVLERHNVPMTIYLAPDLCDGRGRLWWVTLEEVLRTSAEIAVPFPAGEKLFSLRTVADKYAAHREIYAWLRSMPDAGIHEVIDAWAEAAGIDRYAASRLAMTWDEVRSAARHPLITFGAHTMSHASLAKCTAGEATWEMAASIEHVEHELGWDCRHFAYPYGDPASAGEREFDIARRLGLRTAVTTRKGLIGSNVRDCLTALPRLSLNGDFQDARLVQVLLSGAPFKMLDIARSAMPRRAAA